MLAEPIDGEDPTPLLDHLLSIERQTGVRPQVLVDAPAMPLGCDELWHIFNELHGSRGSNGFGPARITYQDIDAFQRVNGLRLHPWELDAIRRADSAFLKRMAERPQT
jgi:hypothetical protein